MALDDRKLLVLATIVEEYIRSGEPVGSKTILNSSKINVSSATVRNDMAALEKMGLRAALMSAVEEATLQSKKLGEMK